MHKSANGQAPLLHQTESDHFFRGGDAKGGVAIQDRDADLNRCDLSVDSHAP